MAKEEEKPEVREEVKPEVREEVKPEVREEERRVTVRAEKGDSSAGAPQIREEEVRMEEPEEVQELQVEIPSELKLSDDEMKKIGKEAANELLDTMSGDRAVTRCISSKIFQKFRIFQQKRVIQIKRFSKIWRNHY
jgi:hypothetical protein